VQAAINDQSSRAVAAGNIAAATEAYDIVMEQEKKGKEAHHA
jgi:hypothetical protein